MQQQLLAAQDELARTEVTGTAGGGLVTATVTGSGELIGLDIDPTAIDPGDAEGLADLVVAADPRRQPRRRGAAAAGDGPARRRPRRGGLSLPGM